MTISNQNQITCPTCKQADQTILVEDLYFALISHDKEVINRFQQKPDTIKKLLSEIRPPELTKLPFWLIMPPDQMLIAAMIALILIIILFIEQTTVGILQLLVLPVLILALYFLGRSRIYSLYLIHKNKREKELQMVQDSVKKWSSFFICLNDQTIFSGHSNDSHPVSELKTIINH